MNRNARIRTLLRRKSLSILLMVTVLAVFYHLLQRLTGMENRWNLPSPIWLWGVLLLWGYLLYLPLSVGIDWKLRHFEGEHFLASAVLHVLLVGVLVYLLCLWAGLSPLLALLSPGVMVALIAEMWMSPEVRKRTPEI